MLLLKYKLTNGNGFILYDFKKVYGRLKLSNIPPRQIHALSTKRGYFKDWCTRMWFVPLNFSVTILLDIYNITK